MPDSGQDAALEPDASESPGPHGGRAEILERIAGSIGGNGNADGLGSEARFNAPQAAAVDNAGNVYVVDTFNHTIRKIDPAGIVSTLAGAAREPGSVDAVGLNARFSYPAGIAVDSQGSLYVADQGNDTIRKVTAGGVVTTLAGATDTPGSADGTGSAARFRAPVGIGVDGAGVVYVADTGNHTIRKITSDGIVTTLAGAAEISGSADATGNAARFNFPAGIAVDSSGIYVADQYNSTIRKVTIDGVVTTLAGSAGEFGTVDGVGVEARFSFPNGLAVDSTGNLYVADLSNATIRKITPARVVTTLAGAARTRGSEDGTGNAARFFGPMGVAVDGGGDIYIADPGNDSIRKVTSAGLVTTWAGSSDRFGSADGTGATAHFDFPAQVSADSAGNYLVADLKNHTIRKITPEGVVTTLAGGAGISDSVDATGTTARFDSPSGVAVDQAGNAYVADTSNRTIRKITASGEVTTVAGTVGVYGIVNGIGSAARFWSPAGLAVDRAGNVFVPDVSTVRKIAAGGVVTTLAGSADFVGSADGTGPNAYFMFPRGVAIDDADNVYVADTANHTIRKITASGVVTTLAGTAGIAGRRDGVAAIARFNTPSGVAVDSRGNVFVADTGNSTIRKITPTGITTTVAGTAGVAGIILGERHRLASPRSLAVVGDSLVISDTNAILVLRHGAQ